MPYFEKENLLFIHIPKNAGKSIEVALGLADKDTLGQTGRRSTINRVCTYAQRLSSNEIAKEKLHGTVDVSLCSQHLTLQEIMLLALLPKEKLETTRSFAIFRDPFERAVSTFMHFEGHHESTSKDFEQFCASWYSSKTKDHNIIAHQRQQIDYILDCRGQIGVDKVLLFQSISTDFPKLCSEWGVKVDSLPHVGLQAKRSRSNGFYTSQSDKIIRKFFADDIEFYESIIST